MSRHYELTTPAHQDVEEIVFQVRERFGLTAALRVFDRFEQTFELLAENPRLGRVRPEFWPAPYLFWPVGPSLVAYRPDTQPIRVVRIARASRDWRVLPARGE